ncbi:hypothetical protein Clacol_010013 [Clathrus columnatus]|uniref:Uncharacterized protein n=1 Tax=Clathrus columnatus TaxID=1419009 RepID=A0AAV5AMT4_9AGAM|nr:hypothetical protein Clacol_010013 [Clathrus columnatus]
MFLQHLTSTLSLLPEPDKEMSLGYDLNKDTNFTTKPFPFKKTTAKDKLHRLSRLVKAASSFTKLPRGTSTKGKNGPRKTASSSQYRDRSVRVSGVDFDIVLTPTSGSSEWLSSLEAEESSVEEDYGMLLPPSYLRRQLSTYSLWENYTSDSLEVQESPRKQLRQFDEPWNQGRRVHFDIPQRPESIYETYSVEKVTKEHVYILTLDDIFISEDLLKFGKPFKQSIADEGLPIEFNREPPPTPSKIRRKPSPWQVVHSQQWKAFVSKIQSNQIPADSRTRSVTV